MTSDLMQLLELLGISQVVVVDDDFLPTVAEYLLAVDAGDAPAIKSLQGVPDDSNLEEHVTVHWDEVTVSEKLEIRSATLKAHREHSDPTGLRELIGGRPFLGLVMAEWESRSERLLDNNRRSLILFDVDFGQETGEQGDTTGLRLAREALSSAGKHIVGLLTNKAETGKEEAAAATWAQESGVPVAEFVVVNKRLLRDGGEDDLEAATNQIRATLQASQLARLRSKVKRALDDGLSYADDQLGGRSPSILEDVVFESSHEGGEWEGDTWFRIYSTLGLDRARHAVAVDPEVRAAISDVRQLLRTRPDKAHHESTELAAEIQQAEAYEDASYVNGAGLPIDNGDLFKTKDGPIYVLVGQPCDLALRPDGRAYKPETATLLPVKKRSSNEHDDTEDGGALRSSYRLPTGGPMGDGEWEVRFRPEHHVAFDVLDLCSLNTDGKTTTHPPKKTTLDPLLPGVQTRKNEIDEVEVKVQKLLEHVDTLEAAKHLEKTAANRIRHAMLSMGRPFKAQLNRKPAAFEFDAQRIGRLTGSYADALLAAHSGARARTVHAHELTRIVRND